MSKQYTTRAGDLKAVQYGWLLKAPVHWETARVKDVARLRSGDGITSEQIEDEGLYPVYGGNGLRGYFSKYNNEGIYALIGRQGALCGNINYAEGKFWASEHAVVAYHKRKINFKWLGEMLRVMNLNQYSIAAAQPGLAMDRVKRLLLPLPPLPEQKAIAGYLDREKARIDRKVGLLEEKARLYKELKQSLINETVTRGLDKSAPLRLSGVDWIGDIPEHWQVKRVKDIGTQSKKKNGANPKGDMLSVSGYRGIEVKNYEHEHQKRTTKELADYRVVTLGQLVVNTMWLNFRGLGVSEIEGYVSPAYRAYDITDDVMGRYLHHLMRSDLYVFGYCIYLQGIRPNSLQMKTIDFEAFPIVLPPLDEQEKIIEYLDEKTTKIDQIVGAIGEQVKLLKELRKTLINDVVTGKIRVTETEEAAS